MVFSLLVQGCVLSTNDMFLEFFNALQCCLAAGTVAQKELFVRMTRVSARCDNHLPT